MGSLRLGQVLFCAISGDHPGQRPPHLHAYVGSIQVIISLLPDGSIGFSPHHPNPIRGKAAKRNQVRAVLEIAEEHYDQLQKLWEESQRDDASKG